MSETRWTPGPWEYSEGADGEHRIYAGVFPGATRAVFDVADVWLPEQGDRAANGRLMAAAPALFEALRELDALPVRELSAGVDSTMRPVTYMAYSAYDVQRIVRAALAQASPPGKEK